MADRTRSTLRDSQTLRRKIDQDLSANEALIDRLRRKLEAERDTCDALKEERSELLERVVELEMYQDARLESDIVERNRELRAALVELEEENAETQKLCRQLCDALETDRERLATANTEISCLEQQVEELKAMVKLLEK